MEQKHFDKIINDALKDLKAPYDAAHWQQMEMLLNNLPVGDESDADAQFDAVVKDRLDQIDIPEDKSWAAIEAGLIQAETADTQFDTAINDKIGAIEGVKMPSIWDNIESALDKAEATDTQFDNQVSTKLKTMEPAYNEKHWSPVLEKLNADYALREKIYQYKLMEVTLMILLLLNFYQYLPSNLGQSFSKESKQTTPTFLKDANEAETLKPTIKENIKPVSTPSNADEKEEVTADNEKRPIAARKTTSDAADNAFNRNLSVNGANQTLKITRPPSRTPSILTPNKKTTKLDFKTGLMIPVSDMNQHLTKHTTTTHSLIEVIPSLQPNFVESQYFKPLGCKDCKYAKVPARLRLGVFANLALTNAYRSGGQILNINALNQKGFGYGTGFSVGFKYGRWEIETGLAYAAKQYDPNIIEQYGGIVSGGGIRRTHFQRIHLQTVNIPVNFRYNYGVWGRGKWHFYTQAGMALNVILRAEYDLAEISNGSRSFSNAVTTSRLKQIKYNKGFFAGDSFKENRYLSINMGTGVERYISPSWSIFVQPEFHFHFSDNRIGPTRDKINTLSISFGARKSL